jgi:hypothetical protein
MRRYIEHIQNNRTPHERRQHAMQIAGVVTMLLFVGWLASLGMRIGGQGPVVNDGAANTAATLQAVQGPENSTLLGY